LEEASRQLGLWEGLRDLAGMGSNAKADYVIAENRRKLAEARKRDGDTNAAVKQRMPTTVPSSSNRQGDVASIDVSSAQRSEIEGDPRSSKPDSPQTYGTKRYGSPARRSNVSEATTTSMVVSDLERTVNHLQQELDQSKFEIKEMNEQRMKGIELLPMGQKQTAYKLKELQDKEASSRHNLRKAANKIVHTRTAPLTNPKPLNVNKNSIC